MFKRAKTFTILLILSTAVAGPAAHALARPSHVAERPAPHATPKAAAAPKHAHTKAIVAKPVAAAKPERGGKHARVEVVAGRHKGQSPADKAPAKPQLTRVHGKVLRGQTVEKAEVAARTPRAQVEPAKQTARAEAVPKPEPEQPEIHVTHDRKHHLAEEPADSAQPVSDGGDKDVPVPQKATLQDFETNEPAPVTPVASAKVPAVSLAKVAVAAPKVPAIKTMPAAKVPVASTPAVGPQVAAAVPVPVVSVLPKGVDKAKLRAAEVVADEPKVIMAALFTKAGRLIMPPAMKGSHEILIHQNTMADEEGLDRIEDDEDLARMRSAKLLLPLPDNAMLEVDDRLPANRRYARPWTVQFLNSLAKAHYARFHSALQVNSAVRTVEFQRNLMRTNGNAAPAEGETASPHLTGQAVDLAKKGLSMTELAWLRGYLLPLVQEGKVDVEEEFQQACFHISVYRKYVPAVAPRREIAARATSGRSALAAAMR